MLAQETKVTFHTYCQSVKQSVEVTMHTMLGDCHFLSFFSILLSPHLHWRLINISTNSLPAFLKETLPREYSEQLRMFYRIFDFKKQR